ncbi:hypothetical protein L226DRAFT_610517 [Lentinus tigrinus ALCF2SS1-7]|uniref:uncharacterized protein n=1 Tax=Lentinus tigrinus ALCF2SS1-7 TaxID=1328758 RepID=UPI001165D981|nr:hypothetical protein L226DRAFT_610517 [Lentinus tigrinus ALCF2SS1-7]
MGIRSTQTIELEHLITCETFWRDRFEWLLECGYELPPQFKPGTPPVITGKTDLKSENEYVINMKVWARTGSADVIQTTTGKMVSLYQVSKRDCLRMLDAYPSWHIPPGTLATFEGRPIRPHRNEPRNRCRPIIAAPLRDKCDPELVFLVTPTSRSHMIVEFTTIGEALRFFRQMIEGLQLLHERQIASGDEALFDVQMDLVTFLPAELELPTSSKSSASHQALSLSIWQALAEDSIALRRREDSSYYFNIPRGLRRSTPRAQADASGAGSKHPAEQEPDPIFRVKAALDIMHLGQMLHRDFIKRFEALSFLRHLVHRMMEDDLAEVIGTNAGVPEWQTTIDEVVEKFNAIVSQLPEEELLEPLGELSPPEFLL